MSEPAQPKGSFTTPDALRLKHELGKSITWKGLNAVEVLSLTEMTADRWRKVYQDYEEWYHHKGMGGFGLWLPVAALLIGAGMYFFTSGDLSQYGRTAMLLGLAWLLWRVGRRQAHREAYAEGYEAGLEQGVYRTLGISDEEAPQLWELGREMELDEDILERLARRRKEPERG